MKRALIVAAALLFLRSGSPAQGVISFGVFYSSLDSYGEWIALEGGVYGWHPTHGVRDWRPYWMGRWAWTSYGWYWVSDEPWGWATYHYGRWHHDEYYGWIWIPGYDWAPAWVEWRYGGDYVGWAPLGPYAIWDFHIGIWYGYDWVTPHHWWAFTDCRYMSSPSLHQHVYRSDENRRFIGRTRDAGAVRYRDGQIRSSGPQREFVERRSGMRVQRADVVDLNERTERITREGSRERIGVYRPRIDDRRVDIVERPARVRDAERHIRLDAGQTDVRVRSMQRSTGRDQLNPGDAGRLKRSTDRQAPREGRVVSPPRRLTPGREPVERSPRAVTPGRNIERSKPEVPRGGKERVGDPGSSRSAEQPRQTPDLGRARPPREATGPKPTERPITRPPEARPEYHDGSGKRER